MYSRFVASDVCNDNLIDLKQAEGPLLAGCSQSLKRSNELAADGQMNKSLALANDDHGDENTTVSRCQVP
jgi:hypothetical protein